MMLFLATSVGKMVGLIAAETTVFFATLTDAEWAAPANTALLIFLTLLAARNGAKVNRVGKDVEHAKDVVTDKVDNAAAAAASAAAAAATAARISMEAGKVIRDNQQRPHPSEGDLAGEAH